MQSAQRKPVRDRRGQLLTLLNGWDPAGVLRAGGPRDEYECIVDTLLAFLSRNPSKEDVAAFMEREVSQNFDTAAPDAPQFAAKVVAWFQMASREDE